MSNICRNAALFACVAFTVVPCLNAASWSAYGDFSTSLNPNGPWSYGSLATLSAPFTPGISGGSDCGNPNVTGWQAPGNFPYVMANTSNTTQICGGEIPIQTGIIHMHPSSEGAFADVRWNSPAAGMFQITGFFQPEHYGDTDHHILLNGVSVFSGFSPFNSNGVPDPFALSLLLVQGDRLDFAVGQGQFGYAGDSTAFSLNITDAAEAPEPSVAVLTGGGLLLCLGLRRRSSRRQS